MCHAKSFAAMKREAQVAEIEAELRLASSPARKKDLRAMLKIAKQLLAKGQ